MAKNFIEIGSCYFNTLEYLSDRGWNGIVVEPQKEIFDVINGRFDNVQYFNVAIANENGEADLWKFNKEWTDEDPDYHGMASLFHPSEKITYDTHTAEYIAENVHAERVETMTYARLLELAKPDTVDLLKIDTEGFDYEIIKQVQFTGALRPRIIMAEHKHTPGKVLEEFLIYKGYHVEVEQDNLYAIDINRCF